MIKLRATLLVISFLFFTGCEKGYLDEPKPTESVNSSVIFESADGTEAFMSGILRASRSQFDRTDAGGLYSMYFARVVKGNDLVLGQQWYLFDYENNNREPNYTRTIFSWEFPYYMINQLNQFILGINGSANLSEIEKDSFLGQAHAMRAFYYFQLALEFQHTYSYDLTLPAPPIYAEPAIEGKAMSTLGELYDFIVADLNIAIETTPTNRTNKSFINRDVVYAIMARVQLVMGNWQEASNAAAIARQAYPLNANQYRTGFDDINASEWIWGMPQRADQTNYFFIAPHAFTDNINDGYGLAFWNKDFVSLFSATDVRNTFFDIYGVGNGNQYFARASSKFTFDFSSDIPIIRSPEMMLIEIEANARLGKESEAATMLLSFQKNRDANAVSSGNTGDALIEEILLERRKELYGEMGVEWFDAKRLRRGITRTGNHRIGSAANLVPDDKKFFLKIPQKEIDANPNIDESVNSNR
ncbi:RagB/SusD family nutrient uptake outer membrane protein [Flavobacteriaceae bacterium]|nr:RagB/SusD family nutrient uptake outer membrane protein [Flavobacteriaceae bacterium]